LPVGLVVLGPLVEVTELSVPVGVLLAFQRCDGALQAETFFAQQVRDSVGGDPVTLGGEFGGKSAGGFRRPSQW
jgi:hypothetical protein